MFSIVPAFQAMGMAALSVIPAELLGAILHGEQDFHFHRPIEPGMELETTSTPIGMRQRSSGVTVVVRSDTRDAAGELVTQGYSTTFVRGAQGAEDAGEEAPAHRFDESLREREPDAEVEQAFDADQTFRYAEASGDPMQIHLDDEFAKSVGLPGIIIHGLCTMAFTSVAAIKTFTPDDPTRLRRLAVRFASIALPEQAITTRLWAAGERDGRAALRIRDDQRRRRRGDQGRLGGDRIAEWESASGRPRTRVGAGPSPSAARRRAGACSTPRSRA